MREIPQVEREEIMGENYLPEELGLNQWDKRVMAWLLCYHDMLLEGQWPCWRPEQPVEAEGQLLSPGEFGKLCAIEASDRATNHVYGCGKDGKCLYGYYAEGYSVAQMARFYNRTQGQVKRGVDSALVYIQGPCRRQETYQDWYWRVRRHGKKRANYGATTEKKYA